MGRGKLRRLRVETASVADGALAAVSRSSPVVRERLFQKSTEFLDVMELFIGRPTGLWLWPGCRTTFSVGGTARRRCSGCWRSRALTTRSGGRRGHWGCGVWYSAGVSIRGCRSSGFFGRRHEEIDHEEALLSWFGKRRMVLSRGPLYLTTDCSCRQRGADQQLLLKQRASVSWMRHERFSAARARKCLALRSG